MGKMRTAKNILVLMPDKHMGDLVVSLPVIKALMEYFKEDNFTLVIDNAYIEIIETINGLNKLLLYPRKKLRESHIIKRVGIFCGFLRRLRRVAPDIAIDLEGRNVSSTLTFLSGAKMRVGRSTAKRSFFYNFKVKLPGGIHKVYSFSTIAAAVGVSIEKINFGLKASDERAASLRNKLRSENIKTDKPIVCIHPGAGKIYKQWSTEGFAEISDWLFSEGFHVVFIGSNSDLKKINEISSSTKYEAYNLGGKLSLGELIAFMGMCSLFIGNDSGPTHLAAVVGAPIIALFGSANERRWGPMSENMVILRGEERCRKCTGMHCEYNYRCIQTISPQDVKSAIIKLLKR
ncbi:MAG: glycosyltransferase family 9 protein [Nitrospirota bacterium]